ncbi:MAG: STAS domain-containing protein, partial [Methylococcales bacterium]
MPEILRNRVGISSYLAPTGPLSDKESFDSLRAEIRNCIEAHETHIVIDLKQVPSVNSQILEILLDTRDHLILIAGTLSLINTNAVVLDALRITNVHSYLNLLDEGINEQLKATSSSSEFTGKRLGDMLTDENLVTEDKIDQAFKLQESTGKRMGQILVEKGWLEEANLLRLLSLQLNVPFVKLRMGLSDPEVTPIINKEVARRLNVLPLFRVRNELTLATCDPQAFPVLDEIKQLTGCSVRPVLARREEILYELKGSASTSFNFDEYIGELEEDFELVDNSIPDDFTTIDEMAGDSPV